MREHGSLLTANRPTRVNHSRCFYEAVPATPRKGRRPGAVRRGPGRACWSGSVSSLLPFRPQLMPAPIYPFLKCCVAAAVPRLGKFLAGLVPGGPALVEVVEFGADVWERWKKEKP